MPNVDNLVEDFILESTELINQAEIDILELENNSKDKQLINKIFRAFHTVKGSAGFLNFNTLQELSHNLENLLDQIRSGRSEVDIAKIDVLLEGIDIINSIFDSIIENGNDEYDIDDLINEVQFILSETDLLNESSSTTKSLANVKSEEDEIEALIAANLNKRNKARNKGIQQEEDKSKINFDNTFDIENTETEDIEALINKNFDRLKKSRAKNKKNVKIIEFHKLNKKEQHKKTKYRDKSDNTLRIDSSKVDDMLNYNEELVLNKNKLLNIMSKSNISRYIQDGEMLNFISIIDNMAKITRDMQEQILEMRRVPISKVLSKYPLMVRKIARELGKKINIQINGGNIKFDRNIVDNMGAPILHLIRNACDHGIEIPAERVKHNKSEVGIVSVDVEEKDSYIVIIIKDDGKGIDTQKIKDIALKKEFITQEEYENMSETEALNCMFIPGFTSKDEANNISGRGVGMDAVKEGVNKLNGTIKIDNFFKTRQGSRVEIRIPLSLRVINAVIFELYGYSFAIPLISISKILYISMKDPRLSTINGFYTLYLDGKVIPIYRLAPVFGIKMHEINYFWGVIVEVDNKSIIYPFIELVKIEEIVVKSFGSFLKKVDCFSGVTVLSDASLMPVMDVVSTKHYVDNHKEQGIDDHAMLGTTSYGILTRDQEIFNSVSSLMKAEIIFVEYTAEKEISFDITSGHQILLLVVDYHINNNDGLNMVKYIKKIDNTIRVLLLVDEEILNDNMKFYIDKAIQKGIIDRSVDKSDEPEIKRACINILTDMKVHNE